MKRLNHSHLAVKVVLLKVVAKAPFLGLLMSTFLFVVLGLVFPLTTFTFAFQAAPQIQPNQLSGILGLIFLVTLCVAAAYMLIFSFVFLLFLVVLSINDLCKAERDSPRILSYHKDQKAKLSEGPITP